ncbi:MAG: hypothetical protein Q9218_007470 [Villophora microphyllina]
MDTIMKKEATSTTKTLASNFSDDDARTLVSSSAIPRGTSYHIWKPDQGGVKITTADMTPLYSVTGFGSYEQRVIITNPADENEILANLYMHSGVSKHDSYIDIVMAGNGATSSGYIIKLQRESGALTRKHKITLSDGRNYILKGKHSTSLMMCWGNLKIVEEGSKDRLAEFTVEWPSSFHKIGTVTFESDVEETVAKEMLFAFLGVANKEYVKAMASLNVAVPPAVY